LASDVPQYKAKGKGGGGFEPGGKDFNAETAGFVVKKKRGGDKELEHVWRSEVIKKPFWSTNPIKTELIEDDESKTMKMGVWTVAKEEGKESCRLTPLSCF